MASIIDGNLEVGGGISADGDVNVAGEVKCNVATISGSGLVFDVDQFGQLSARVEGANGHRYSIALTLVH